MDIEPVIIKVKETGILVKELKGSDLRQSLEILLLLSRIIGFTSHIREGCFSIFRCSDRSRAKTIMGKTGRFGSVSLIGEWQGKVYMAADKTAAMLLLKIKSKDMELLKNEELDHFLHFAGCVKRC